MSRTRIAILSEKNRAQRLIRSGQLDDSELSVIDMILMSYDAQEEIEEGWFDDFAVIELKYLD